MPPYSPLATSHHCALRALYLASPQCPGLHSLTELATRLGPISLGALTHAREKMQ